MRRLSKQQHSHMTWGTLHSATSERRNLIALSDKNMSRMASRAMHKLFES